MWCWRYNIYYNFYLQWVYYTVTDICAYNPSSIQCNEAVAGWIFNSNSGMCEFGGCKGRGNIFTTMAECVKNCGGQLVT